MIVGNIFAFCHDSPSLYFGSVLPWTWKVLANPSFFQGVRVLGLRYIELERFGMLPAKFMMSHQKTIKATAPLLNVFLFYLNSTKRNSSKLGSHGNKVLNLRLLYLNSRTDLILIWRDNPPTAKKDKVRDLFSPWGKEYLWKTWYLKGQVEILTDH